MAQQTLLVVDDEDGVIHAIHQTLEASEYRVLATTDPHRALAMLRAGEVVDLMIIDLFMPAMGGGTLLKECRQIRPDLRVLLSSGLASDGELRRWRRRGEVVVPKPWRDEEFRDAVQRALSRGSPAALPT
jgi:CheY-like chemotaxis protein